MREHPLLMKGPLVRATLEGRKTQTRRPLRNQPPIGYGLIRVCGPWAEFVNDVPPLAKFSTKSPLGRAGDRLWVRETFKWMDAKDDGVKQSIVVAYKADTKPLILPVTSRPTTGSFAPSKTKRFAASAGDHLSTCRAGRVAWSCRWCLCASRGCRTSQRRMHGRRESSLLAQDRAGNAGWVTVLTVAANRRVSPSARYGFRSTARNRGTRTRGSGSRSGKRLR